MLQKTEGIVFRFVKYRESSIIVTIFTSNYGLQTYIINGARSKKAHGKIALYQPLSLLDMVVYHKENSDIKRISEAKSFHPNHNISLNTSKSVIAIFLTEILNKVVKEEASNLPLFEFFKNSIIMLDTLNSNYENFHLTFLLKLSNFLGFGSSDPNEIIDHHQSNQNQDIKPILNSLISSNYGQSLPLNRQTRMLILNNIIWFYRQHIELGQVKSIQVLQTVLD